MRVIPLCVVLGGWLSMPAFAADAGADSWLQRLVKAEEQQSYFGTFVYERNGSFSSHSVWQLVQDGAVRERLLQLDGPAAEVVLKGGQVACATEELASQVSDAQPWRRQQLDPAQLSESYDLHMIGESRVAGRPTVAIVVSPKDQHRYGFELHLDKETSLPLKSLMLSESGQLLERFQFTQFSSGPVQPSDIEAGQDCEPVAISSSSEAKSEAPKWRSEWLPAGFRLLDSNVRPSPASSEPVAWLSYGDGLARFSVFLEPLRGAVVEDARSQMGPTVAVSKRITTADGDVMVTVVGEIPLGTAERVALSMRAGSDQASQ
ncbi:MucB/RseB C-terminal domain-containing protein [Pseudomonas sp. PS1]|uniref:MucB/RseB C-terminal domain-containing protein n=1 Tax=Stutzerimonas marianensis TaxID=2929513 RepID=A0A9X2ATD7_9GAMM|nr:MucB/RseB C-terminal domain-containing protein [Pseudomonas marianensis]MCJ0974944.1 MucB/RseB C-terminal domain-containing protein [Pseudomonas marianensis]